MKRIPFLSMLLTLCLTAPHTYAQAVNVQDSLALVDLYGWKQGPVSTWPGVTVTDGRVTRLSLPYNEITFLPVSFGNLTNLNFLDLGSGELSSLPASFRNLVNLQGLDITENQFTFATLEWVVQDFPFARYGRQFATIKPIQKGNTLVVSVGGTPKNNTFTWYRDEVLDTIIKADSTYAPTKAGTYRVEANNAIATEVTLYSDAVHFMPICAGCTILYRDADGDGFGDPHLSKVAKEKPRGYVSNNLDCDDKNNTKGGPEVCDGIDNDCDGIIDNGLPQKTFYSDYDKDGYGSDKRTIRACTAPPRYLAVSGDCNDDDSTVHPGAKELCDGKDNDCNGTIDDGLPQHPFYWDHDKDGYGFFRPVYACAAPRGYIAQGGDCNDNNPNIHPSAIEHCDGIDEDCDGIIDNGFPQKRFYKDEDGDGWGGKSNRMAGCAPPGYVERSGDCDDHNPHVHPGAPEISGNGIDDNCNGQVDEATTTVTLYSTARGPAFGEGFGSEGNIFSYTPTTSTYVNWWDFGINSGGTPFGGLTKGKDNKLYGTTYLGGTIFSFDPNTATYTPIANLGVRPQGNLLLTTDGKFCGKAEGGTHGEGVLYSFDTARFTITHLFDFDGANSGALHDPFSDGLGPGELMQAADEKLYGTTLNGGAHEMGTLFSFDPLSSTFTKLLDFDNTTGIYAGLVQATNSKLYGVASKGGTNNVGFVFTLDTVTNKIEEVVSFDSSVGIGPNQLIQGLDGKLYGTAGGGANNAGIIFSFDPATTRLTKLADGAIGNLMQASDGKFYGAGGQSIFSFDPATAIFTWLFDFPQQGGRSGPLNGLVEYNPTCKQITYYQDKDSDTYGNSNVTISIASCTPPKGYLAVGNDCNDTDPKIHPGPVISECNYVDENCDGTINDGGCGGIARRERDNLFEQNTNTSLHLTAVPNPSQHYFNLRVESSSAKPVQVRVVDAVGRVVEVKQGIASNTTLILGYNYRPGVYYVQAVQDKQQASVKLVKQAP